jgi:TRAP-type mannitol/chloroaromatic compound transport system permease small subunit
MIGYIATRCDNNKMPLVISTVLVAVSNVLYGYIQSINNIVVPNKFWMMFARFIMGVGAGPC